MREFMDSAWFFIQQNWVIIAIVVGMFVLLNVILVIFSKMKKNKKNKKNSEFEAKEPVLHNLTDEERKNYENKINFLETRVSELEGQIAKHEQEANDAKMSTLNLTNALEELKTNVENDEVVEDEVEDDSNISIVNIDEEVNTDDKLNVESKDNVETNEVTAEEEKLEVENTDDTSVESEDVINNQIGNEQDDNSVDKVEKLNNDSVKQSESNGVVETEKQELPEKLVQLRSAIYANIKKSSEDYGLVDADTPREEVERIKADLEKSKKQLEQYKIIASKYKDN